MYIISKAVIIIPLVVLMIGTMFAFQNRVNNAQKILSSANVSATPIPVSKPSSSSKVKIDLQGPLVCNYSSSKAAMSTFIKNKNVLMKRSENNKISNYLLKGDCLYSWENGVPGTKTCGLSQYISTFEALSKMGVMDIENAIGSLSQFQGAKNISSQEAEIKELFKTCKIEEIKDNIFDIPSGVVFKEIKK